MTNRSTPSNPSNSQNPNQRPSQQRSQQQPQAQANPTQSEGDYSTNYSPEQGSDPHASSQPYSSSTSGAAQPGTDSSAIIQLMRELNEVKQVASSQVNRSAEDVGRLRGQLRWLTGISAVAIVLLGGALIGVTLGLRQEQTALRENQQEMTEQIETLQAQRGNPEQLNRMEELLASINENAQNLGEQTQDILENLPEASGDQLRQIQEDLQDLQQGVRENLSQEGALERLNNLYERVRGMVSNDGSSEGENTSNEGNSEGNATE